MARSGFVRWNAAVADSCLRAGPGQVESAGHLSLRRGVRRMGHHRPGMIRGLRRSRVVRRFRWRFIFAPNVFLLVVCVGFLVGPQKGILLVVFFGAIGHGLMETYGFCRIDDAKTEHSIPDAPVDFAMCLSGLPLWWHSRWIGKRHPGHVLHVWRAIYPARLSCAAGQTRFRRGHFVWFCSPRTSCSHVVSLEPSNPVETWIAVTTASAYFGGIAVISSQTSL